MKASCDPRQAEILKYETAYRDEGYRMGWARFLCASEDLEAAPWRGSFLDVGCGRGEMLRVARDLGYRRVAGTEVVPFLIGEGIVHAPAWDLPFEDDSFDVVSLFDVIEHLLPEDAAPTCRELRRVARGQIILTAANYSSRSTGVELHVNRRPYGEWDMFLREVFALAIVEWLPRRHGINSETWRVTL